MGGRGWDQIYLETDKNATRIFRRAIAAPVAASQSWNIRLIILGHKQTFFVS